MIFARVAGMRGVSIDHPLGKIPDAIREDRLLELVARLRAGDDSVSEEIVRGHVHLAISIASKYARFAPHRAEELVSESVYGIIFAVAKAREKLRDDNIKPWIAACCHRFSYRFLDRDVATVRKPRSTIRDERARGEDSQPVVVTSLSVSEGRAQRCCRPLADVRDTLSAVVRDEEDATILELREAGYNDREIASRLSVSPAYVSRVRGELRRRFDRLEGTP